MVVAMAFMLMAIPVQAEPEAWRERVIAAVRPGAVVARRGLDNDPTTQAVLLGQGGGRWSHVGIAVQLIPDGQIYIESAMPGAGTARGNRNQFAASHNDRLGSPKIRTAAPQPQKARRGHPEGCPTISPEAAATARIRGTRALARSGR